MNLLSTNIYLNCIRLLLNYATFNYYICIQVLYGAVLHNSRQPFHLLVYSGGWFFYLRQSVPYTRKHPEKGECVLYAGQVYTRLLFFWFRVSESGHRYAHKIPILAEFQDKNSTLENSHNSMQCPKPDNMRPKKAILPFFWESLERNNGLTLGRLVSIVQENAGLWHLGFLREKGLCLITG